MINKVDHVTMVVKDLDAALKSFEDLLHLTPEKRSYVGETAERRLAMLPTKGGARIELIQPKPGDKNRFSKFLKERGEGVVGLSIFCTNFDEEVANLKKKGVPIEEEIGTVHPGYPFRIAWVPPERAHGVWLEYVDSEALPPGLK